MPTVLTTSFCCSRLFLHRNRDRSHTKQTGRVRRASNSRSRSRSRSQTCTPASPHPDGRSPSQASSYRHRSPSPLPPQPPRPPRRVQRSISISQTSHIKSPGSRHSRSCSPHPPLPPRKPRRLRTQTPCSPSSGSSIDGRPCKVPSRSTRRGISPSRSADSRHWDVEGGSVGRVRPITTPNDHSPSSRNSYTLLALAVTGRHRPDPIGVPRVIHLPLADALQARLRQAASG